jgi:hypothetical protein
MPKMPADGLEDFPKTFFPQDAARRYALYTAF